MEGMKGIVFVLCSVVGTLAVAGDVEGRNDFKSVFVKANASTRLDEDVDPTTTFTALSGAPTSSLFGQCKSQADTATGRFKEINLPSLEQYTRYVPSAVQRNMYDPAWTKVTSVPINSVLECSYFADQKKAMMFKYVGSTCSISSLRLATSSPACGDRTAEAYFVRTSCPEPVVSSVTLTPSAAGMGVAWVAQDPCQLATNYRVSWEGGNHLTMDNSATNYLVTGLTGCQAVAFTVVALDVIGQPFGTPKMATDTTSNQAPVISNVTIKATGMVTYETTWHLDDPCKLVKSFSLEYSNGPLADAVAADVITGTAAAEDTMAKQVLSDCTDLEVTVNGLDDALAELTDATSDPDIPLHTAVCNNGFMPICSGCFFQANWTSTFAAAVAYCTDLEPDAEMLTVASHDEFTALRGYLNTFFPGPNQRFWVNLHKYPNGTYYWGGTGYVQPIGNGDWAGDEPNDGGTCGHAWRGTSWNYKIGDMECLCTGKTCFGMCFYN